MNAAGGSIRPGVSPGSLGSTGKVRTFERPLKSSASVVEVAPLAGDGDALCLMSFKLRSPVSWSYFLTVGRTPQMAAAPRAAVLVLQ